MFAKALWAEMYHFNLFCPSLEIQCDGMSRVVKVTFLEMEFTALLINLLTAEVVGNE